MLLLQNLQEDKSMFRGYMGKLLRVDLSRGEMREETLDENICRRYIGGYGIGARLIFSEQAAGVTPLGPDNILGFISGPFTGTPAISGTRFTVVGKSPLTGCWGDANSGGTFGAFLKFSGYDGIFFKGISERPVYLFVDNGKAELRDAAYLWGKDTYETEDILKSELGKDISVATIGPGGEKLSLISGIIHNKGSAAARSGLGALMGSKKLKSVVVKGNMKVPLADEAKVTGMRKKYLAELGGHVDVMRKYGTTFTTVSCIETGDSPVKNWKGIASVDFPDASPLDAKPIADRQLKKVACYQCPIGCEATLKAGTGEYKYEDGTYRPEYETLAMLGSNCLNTNLESIIKANDLCNRYGIDTISIGAVIAFAMECYENGLITAKDTGGIDLTWGNHRALVDITEKLCRREGFGDVLADGVQAAAQKIGGDAIEYAIHVHGQEVPGHNPLAGPFMGNTYITNATPARHTQGSETHHSEGLIPDFDRSSLSEWAQAYKKGSNFQHILMCSGMCLFVNMAIPHVDVISDFMNGVTGWDVNTEELLVTGERIANIRQAFNIREGINPVLNKLSGRLIGQPPHSQGPLAGVTVDADGMEREYLKAMDWDQNTGKPTKEKLVELGLEDVARELGY
jgi:aldehyde:ferredoxin oxidoreductase